MTLYYKRLIDLRKCMLIFSVVNLEVKILLLTL